MFMLICTAFSVACLAFSCPALCCVPLANYTAILVIDWVQSQE